MSPNAPAIFDQIADTPLWFPQVFDAQADRLLMVRRGEQDYRAASFLDQRSLTPQMERHIIGWDEVASALPSGARRDAQFIFHIGHVGSTLISRLLGEIEGVLALREPVLLRSLAEIPREQLEWRLDVTRALLSRTFRASQRAIVKATSFTSEIAHRLLPPGSRALFLYATPANYIRGIMAGEASLQELAFLAPKRAARLRTRCPAAETVAVGDATRAAEAWACEMTSLETSAALMPPGSVMWLDFDRFLSDPPAHLKLIADFLGCPIHASRAHAICSGPLMTRYSKALEYEYSPQLRRELLDEAGAANAAAIDDALRWLARNASRCPLIDRALHRAEERHVQGN